MTTTVSNSDRTDIIKAFLRPAVPVNPKPFIITLMDGVNHRGTDWIKTDEAKAILFVLQMMAYDSLFSIDSTEEFQRLRKSIEPVTEFRF
jgi:hypothetical protein